MRESLDDTSTIHKPLLAASAPRAVKPRTFHLQLLLQACCFLHYCGKNWAQVVTAGCSHCNHSVMSRYTVTPPMKHGFSPSHNITLFTSV